MRAVAVTSSRASERGFTLLEVAVAGAVLALGIVGVLAAVAASDQQDEHARQQSIAIDAARRVAAAISAQPFREIFSRFNGTTADDPATVPLPDIRGRFWRGGTPTLAPWFHIDGLTPIAGDPEVCMVVFPVVTGAPGVLREDVTDAAIWQIRFGPRDPRSALLGMPRDLSGDSVTGTTGVESSYVLLPVLITLRWQTAHGVEGIYALRILIADRSGGS